MRVEVKDVEIRGYEEKQSKHTEEKYLLVYFEDVTGKSNNVLCRNMELAKDLRKGLVCNLDCELSIAKYTKFELNSIIKKAS